MPLDLVTVNSAGEFGGGLKKISAPRNFPETGADSLTLFSVPVNV